MTDLLLESNMKGDKIYITFIGEFDLLKPSITSDILKSIFIKNTTFQNVLVWKTLLEKQVHMGCKYYRNLLSALLKKWVHKTVLPVHAQKCIEVD